MAQHGLIYSCICAIVFVCHVCFGGVICDGVGGGDNGGTAPAKFATRPLSRFRPSTTFLLQLAPRTGWRGWTAIYNWIIKKIGFPANILPFSRPLFFLWLEITCSGFTAHAWRADHIIGFSTELGVKLAIRTKTHTCWITISLFSLPALLLRCSVLVFDSTVWGNSVINQLM